jgi:hypothetical protein
VPVWYNGGKIICTAIDAHEGEKIDQAAFKALIREAAALNGEASAKRR